MIRHWKHVRQSPDMPRMPGTMAYGEKTVVDREDSLSLDEPTSPTVV